MREEAAALRAELRSERGIEFGVRIGVNTGEAVTGASPSGGHFTAGDIVNVAARLEQAARPGDILLGRDTFSLVRHAVEAEPVAPLTVKGKREVLEAHRLLGVATDARGRPERPRAPMVGRERERRRLLDTFHQAVADSSCHLFTVLGAAGVGKSRLVAEVLETIDGAATVAVGRCLPYEYSPAAGSTRRPGRRRPMPSRSLESGRRPIATWRCARPPRPRVGASGTRRGRGQVATRSRCTLRTQGQRHLRRPRPRDDRAPRPPRRRHRRLGPAASRAKDESVVASAGKEESGRLVPQPREAVA